ncbi:MULTISPECIES: HyaD/HybD family hydrogenase maturation endopeptidase [unclassified Pseudomonas]|uniref:HyaD/HybD family hydrogenase maturation endopeptidase n=1 Tax=unclassified Pseudomonas TaxID=196821 RepID=UPI002AB3FA5D|nr:MULTISPECIES: HyaD/HybD family hydrogenase maturation endopeptidase [unclassified Pseudomonas]MDY7559653.1 HyaD/HybD family hydrogenase maturation endopeptidase [Pseudomonas sp. AB6]MEA9977971.1 HyaD/HybD family hydrogenase maturation endopeptidase [Pseudomonas sp. RTS4]MEA9993111.1 HyaD/HybD family hydrogenase maturation endopeptidase [Pseudomonas sp. AA4]MEB0041121.1 HyaD/HybD family hydrogenase maturation endopeptidase [Pseudomonas sp. MH10]MEB0078568.1 HyaD/HybD family hydrogenase matur
MKTSASPRPRITVLGIGNLLWADEGFGVRCVEALQQRYEFADNVALIDGGTQGLYLIQHVQEADYLLIFDAVDYNLTPGELKFVTDDEVPKFLGIKKLSLHQTGFQEVLMLAQLTGHFPQRVLLIGCQPEHMMDYGGSLRPVVRAAMEGALTEAVRVLETWGAEPRQRASPLTDEEAVTLPHLELDRYEGERPSAQNACRIGDERILARRV